MEAAVKVGVQLLALLVRSTLVTSMKKLVTAALAVVALVFGPAAFASNDPAWPQQWGPQKVGAESAWSASTGRNIIVAVVDTGADLGHEDLQGKLVAGATFTDQPSGTAPQDDDGHGSHVSGIIAAATNNGIGIAGMAPDAKIMPVRALGHQSGCNSACGSASDINTAIKWAVDHGAKVVNLSLGDDVAIRTVIGSSIQSGLDYAWQNGAIPVVAGGNDNMSLLVPSGYRNVNALIVGATTSSDAKASFSNNVGDAKWGMVAPGADILSLWKNNGYARASGTSMAAPHVSGAAALLLAQGLTQQQTVDRLLATATDLGASGNDLTFGYGRLNASAAVIRTAPATTPATGSTTSSGTPRSSSSGTSSGGSRASGSTSGSTSAGRPASAGEPATVATDTLGESSSPLPDGQTPSPSALAVRSPTTRNSRGGSSGLIALAGLAGVTLAGAGVVGVRRFRRGL